MDKNKYNPHAIRDAFQFLVDEFEYLIIYDKELSHNGRPYAFVIEYVGNDRRVLLSQDYKENFFYFTLMRCLNAQYPNDSDRENIRAFWHIFKISDPELKFEMTQPVNQTCAEAALFNAQLLRKYTANILRGEEWI